MGSWFLWQWHQNILLKGGKLLEITCECLIIWITLPPYNMKNSLEVVLTLGQVSPSRFYITLRVHCSSYRDPRLFQFYRLKQHRRRHCVLSNFWLGLVGDMTHCLFFIQCMCMMSIRQTKILKFSRNHLPISSKDC